MSQNLHLSDGSSEWASEWANLLCIPITRSLRFAYLRVKKEHIHLVKLSFYLISIQLLTSKEFQFLLLRFTVVIKVHLLNIKRAEMTPLTNGCPWFLWSYGSLPWPLGKVSLAVVHYGSVVVRNSQAVDGTMTILFEVVLVIWRDNRCYIF